MQLTLDQPQEKRQFTRFSFRQPVLINRGEWQAEEGSLSGDVSEGGIRLSVNDFIPVGAPMMLEITLPDASEIIPVDGKVAWIRFLPYSERYQIGVQFGPQQYPSKLEFLRIVNPQLQPI